MSNLRKIVTTEETLEDLVSLINNSRADGVTKVSAEFTPSKKKIIVTLDYGKKYSKNIFIDIQKEVD